MAVRLAIAMTVAVTLFGSQASAQQRNQTIQLPVIRQFSVRSSVSVPDGGTIGLGGITRSSAGSISRGVPGTIGRPFSNRAGGRVTSSGHASVQVWVLPTKEEINQAILAGATSYPKESTVPYYQQVWDKQLSDRQPSLILPPDPPQRFEQAPVGDVVNPADRVAEPEGIFLGLP